MNYIGLDPGVSGAIALLAIQDGGSRLRVFDIPTIKLKRGLTKKRKPRMVTEIDEPALFSMVADMVYGIHAQAAIEKVHSMHRQGVASSFAFGQSYGQQRMALAAAGIAYQMVSPNKWKGVMGCGADKDTSLAVCLREFPGQDRLWFGSKNGEYRDGRAEAALLALYASRHPI